MNSSEKEHSHVSLFFSASAWVFGIPWTLVCAIIALTVAIVTRNSRTVYWIAKGWARVLLAFSGIKVKVHGLENLISEKTFLIIANHQSLCDIPVLCGYFPVQLSWIAKKELFKIPFFGHALAAAEYIPIDRENRESAFKSLELACQMLQKRPVMIFPEGTRSRTGKLGQFKHGALFIASKAQQPILPVTITNSYERIPPERKGLVPGTVHVTIDPLIHIKGKNRSQIRAILDQIHQSMSERIDASQT